jgi:putative hemolysin
VGSIQDEYDDEQEQISRVSADTFDMLGNTDFADAMQALEKEVPQGMDFDTIGGFVVDLLGHIPTQGENAVAVWEDIEFRVLETDETRIGKLRAVRKKQAQR